VNYRFIELFFYLKSENRSAGERTKFEIIRLI